MTYMDPEGSAWASIAEAASIVHVHAGTIRQWIHRSRVRVIRVSGAVWVHVDDVRDAELAWRKREFANRQPVL